jgi:ubiquinone/menaquinone biosynthesis C-methylase UbiE
VIVPDELPVEQGYTLWASCYDDDGNPLTAIEGPAMAAWFGDIKGRSVIDLGCGTGRHTEQLVKAGAKVVAVDLTVAMLDLARAKLPAANVTWLRLALPGPLPFANDRFALAVMGLVAEHVQDLTATLKEVARILEPGGRCLLSALHADRTRAGQKARFIDQETGQRRPILTIHRERNAYLEAAENAELTLIHDQELFVSNKVAAALPRALPYVGQALGWFGVWQK